MGLITALKNTFGLSVEEDEVSVTADVDDDGDDELSTSYDTETDKITVTATETVDVEEVAGIASTYGERLRSNGYETAEDVADASVDGLTNVQNVGESTAERFIENASETVK